MKVCFPVNHDRGLEGPIYAHFGSAPKFLMVDTESKEVKIIDNSNAHHQHGSCNPALALAGYDIDAVIVGGIGAGALSRLNSLGLNVYEAVKGSVSSNLEKFLAGELKEMSVSSCHDHDHHHEHEHGTHGHEHRFSSGRGMGLGRGIRFHRDKNK
ncbi:MAG: NifB/NifX family molybdenum-iron cluster-binding protein [Deferribacterales bacterium]